MIGLYACMIALVIACLAMVVQNIIMRGQIATAMETIATIDDKYHTDIDGLKRRLDIQDGIVKENNDMCSENYGLMNRTLAAAEHTQYNALEALNRVTCTRRRLDEIIDSVNASTGRHFKHTDRIETPESAYSTGIETAKENTAMADHTVWHCSNCGKAFLEEDMKHQQTTMDAYVCDPVHYFSGDYLTIEECPYCGSEDIEEDND